MVRVGRVAQDDTGILDMRAAVPNLGFYFKSHGKPMKSFKQENDVQFEVLKKIIWAAL